MCNKSFVVVTKINLFSIFLNRLEKQSKVVRQYIINTQPLVVGFNYDNGFRYQYFTKSQSIFTVSLACQHVRVPVRSHQRRRYVRYILHDVLQVSHALVVQSHLPLLLHQPLHLCCTQSFHFRHHGCL